MYIRIKKNLLGDVFLPENTKVKHAAIIYILITLTVGAFLLFAKYTQRENVPGIIYPEEGIFVIRSDKNGSLNQFKVQNGTHVNKNDILFTVDSSHASSKYKNNEEDYTILLKRDSDYLLEEKSNEIKSYNEQLKSIDEEIKEEEISIGRIGREIDSIEKSLAINNKAYKKLEKAYEDKIITIIDKNNAQSQLLDKILQQSSLEREMDEKKKNISDLKMQKSIIENKIASSDVSYKEKKIDNTIQNYDIADRYEYTQKSPAEGIITSVIKRMGDQVQSGEYIMSIIPDGIKYKAVVFISPSSIGRVKTDRRVTLHIDSYPYQRFGVIYGNITNISNTPLSTEDIYRSYNVKVDHPSYMVMIDINSRSNKIKLIPYMTLKADIPLETRALFKWLYAALFKNENGIVL